VLAAGFLVLRPRSATHSPETPGCRRFQRSPEIPAKVLTGRKYTLTAKENLGTGFYAFPVVGHVVNPETIYFK